MTGLHGRFVWYELMTTDLDAAEAFYRAVVGWGTADTGMAGGRYTICSAGPARIAGMMVLPPEIAATGGRPGWIGYIGADDVDAAAEQVRATGGAVHRAPSDIPGIGRMAVVADPQGAIFCLFHPQGAPGARAAPDSPGTIGWHELLARDWAAAFAFYAEAFGWRKEDAVDMGPMGTYQLFAAAEGPAIGGMMNKPDMVPHPAWNYYITVEAADAAAARVKAGGGQVVMGPMEVPGGQWVLQAMDPQGAFFCLVAPAR